MTFAKIPNSTDAIHGCYGKDGQLWVIDEVTCWKGEDGGCIWLTDAMGDWHVPIPRIGSCVTYRVWGHSRRRFASGMAAAHAELMGKNLDRAARLKMLLLAHLRSVFTSCSFGRRYGLPRGENEMAANEDRAASIEWLMVIEPDEPVTPANLEAMGFDLRQLSFYAWLVAHGREPRVPAASTQCLQWQADKLLQSPRRSSTGHGASQRRRH